MHVKKTLVPLQTGNGSVIVIPAGTNRRFAHSVPHSEDSCGRRISVTMRGFIGDDPRGHSEPS